MGTRRAPSAGRGRRATPRTLRTGVQPKPPVLRALGPHARKTGGFLALDIEKHPKLRAWQQHLRTFGGFGPWDAKKHPKLRAYGGHARKNGGFGSVPTGKHPKLRAYGGHARKRGGFAVCCRPAPKLLRERSHGDAAARTVHADRGPTAATMSDGGAQLLRDRERASAALNVRYPIGVGRSSNRFDVELR